MNGCETDFWIWLFMRPWFPIYSMIGWLLTVLIASWVIGKGIERGMRTFAHVWRTRMWS